MSTRYIFLIFVCIRAAPISNIKSQGDLEYFKDYDELSPNLIGELGEHFEGDMLLSPQQRQKLNMAQSTERNGLLDTAKRWPNRTVVYYIEQDDFDDQQIQQIKAGMEDISNKSCIRFVPSKSKTEHAVRIQGSADGCFSNVGFSAPDEEGEVHQVLNLHKGCFKHGTVVHEMLHTIGFYHMQSTHDRDDYVEIVWENISPGKEFNFAKYNNKTVTNFGVPYDYTSVMHYPSVAFSKNGQRTIIPLQEDISIGQRQGLSQGDVIKLNRMYCAD